MRLNIIKPLLFLGINIVFIIVCYFWVNQQVLWFLVQHHSQHYKILSILANDIVAILSILILYSFIRILSDKIISIEHKLLSLCNAVVLAIFLKTILKIVFGRYWPATFFCHNTSLVSNNAYGFNWFKSGTAYGSFPSGHTTFIVAFGVSLWLIFPKLRGLAGLLMACVMAGQIGMYYHFVSDVIAGATLGGLVAFSAFKYQKI
jgi:membrane-associated phospholipid phosphatase